MDRTKWTRKQVADHFGVKSSCVSHLLRQRKNNANLVEEHAEKQRGRKLRLKAVMKHARAAMASKHGLIRAEDVRTAALEHEGLNVTGSYVCSVLRADMGLRYRPVKLVNSLANTSRCLILRQKYAKFMLDLLHSGKRIINID